MLEKSNEEHSPFQTEYEGWMGNYGNSLERWYHRAAIILWPEKTNYASLFAIQPDKILSEMTKILKKNRVQGKEILQQILPQWDKLKTKEPKQILKVLHLAAMIDDSKLATHLLQSYDLGALSQITKPGLTQIFSTYGEEWSIDLLHQWSPKTPYHRTELLKDLFALVKAFYLEYPKIANWLLEYQFTSIVKRDEYETKNSNDRQIAERSKTRLQEIKTFLRAILEVGDLHLHQKTMEHFSAHPYVYTAKMLSQLLQEISFDWKKDSTDSWGFRKLLNATKQQLQIELTQAKRQEGDWSIAVRFCCTCNECKQLKSS